MTKKVLIGIGIFFFLIYFFAWLPIGMGSTGLRPKTAGCLGLTLGQQFVFKVFPDGRARFWNFSYYVDSTVDHSLEKGFCLGKDIFYGE